MEKDEYFPIETLLNLSNGKNQWFPFETMLNFLDVENSQIFSLTQC